MALNNHQWLICHKSKPNQTKPNMTGTTTPSQNEPGINRSKEVLYTAQGYHWLQFSVISENPF